MTLRRSSWIALAVAAAIVAVPLACIAGAPSRVVRVFSRQDRIVVDTTTGRWSHRYSLVVGPGAETSASSLTEKPRDSTIVPVSRAQHDQIPTGTRVRLRQPWLFARLAWIADSTSATQSFVHAMSARRVPERTPEPVSPLDAQTAGLARVVRVHSVKVRQSLNDRATESTGRPGWIHLVEIEFWARSTRTVVRTIDVIDAASIPGLRPGTILQMHYNLRDPRMLRIDDGTRTFTY